ncbi:hypothetical protein P171DRAFT_445674 [Karstenula rhodostoma CBS 690.94]|uniref:Uncharacterized protein n=1 Tax=Karstenula rhodostoma CBS 690.94 TaxID=1392251 RepID=A0A9P4PFT1_9PLEO|nr:hypothetical protein P171DRAFT_445674 [Karstenula rhodostoma CBS 690.94]
MSIDIVGRVRQRLANTTLIGPEIDLSFHGKSRAKYIYTQAKAVAHQIELIDYWVEEQQLTKEKFVAGLNFRDADSAIVARGICKSFESIFDTFTHNLQISFQHGGGPADKMQQRFPELWSWTIPRHEIRLQRNKSAHGCGISPCYIEDLVEADNYGNKMPFVATEFWDNVVVNWIPAMREELYDLLFLLQRDLQTMKELTPDKPSLPIETLQKRKPCLPLQAYLPCLQVLIWFFGAILSIYQLLYAPNYATYWCVSLTKRVLTWPLDRTLQFLDADNEIRDAGYRRIDSIHGWFVEEFRDLQWQHAIAEQPEEESEVNWQDDVAFPGEIETSAEHTLEDELNPTWSTEREPGARR